VTPGEYSNIQKQDLTDINNKLQKNSLQKLIL